MADSIVAARRNLRPEQRLTTAWLYQEGLLDAGQFKKLAPYLTARALQFHFHVLGYGVPSGRYRVLEAIIDVSGPAPSITYLRDLTRQGLPFRIEKDSEGGENTPATGSGAQPGQVSANAFPGRRGEKAIGKSARVGRQFRGSEQRATHG